MWGTEEFRKFKSEMHIGDVVRIIRRSINWDEVRDECEKL